MKGLLLAHTRLVSGCSSPARASCSPGSQSPPPWRCRPDQHSLRPLGSPQKPENLEQRGTSLLYSPSPSSVVHRNPQLQAPGRWRCRRQRRRRGRRGPVGGGASLVPLRLLLQLVEVAAGPAAHLAAAPGAALWPHRSRYVTAGAGRQAPLPVQSAHPECEGGRDQRGWVQTPCYCR